LYRYVGNGPANAVDPDGLLAGWIIVGVVVVGTIIAYATDPWIEVKSDPHGSTAETHGPFTFYGPEFKSLPDVLKESTRIHEWHHKYHEWGYWPWDTFGREKAAYSAERDWLLKRKARTAIDDPDFALIGSEIASIDALLADGGASLKTVCGTR